MAEIRTGDAEFHILARNKIRRLTKLRMRFECERHGDGACAGWGKRLYRSFTDWDFMAANNGLRVRKINGRIAARLAAAEENAILTDSFAKWRLHRPLACKFRAC